MLQQTQVSTVIPYFQRFMRAFPTMRHLARAPEQKVLKIWEGLGYYSRARHLHGGAKFVVRRFSGRVPSDRDTLLNIPGIGNYTANAILSIAFDQPWPVYDGNVRRVVARLTASADPPKNPSGAPAIRRLLEGWIHSSASPGAFNQAIMELGQTICTPRSPRCLRCPIAFGCKAHSAGREEEFPKRRPRRAIPHYRVAIGIIQRNGRVLIQKRPSKGLLGGLWEFPGGKIERGETPARAIRREVREELGLAVQPNGTLPRVDHAYSHFSVTLHPFLCVPVGRWPGRLPRHARWVRMSELGRYPFPAANRKILANLAAIPPRVVRLAGSRREAVSQILPHPPLPRLLPRLPGEATLRGTGPSWSSVRKGGRGGIVLESDESRS